MALVNVVESAADAVWHIFKIFLMLVVVVLIVGGVWVCYILFTRSQPSTTEHAQVINNTSYYPSKRIFFLGFTLWGTDIGISKYSDPTMPVVKEGNKI